MNNKSVVITQPENQHKPHVILTHIVTYKFDQQQMGTDCVL